MDGAGLARATIATSEEQWQSELYRAACRRGPACTGRAAATGDTLREDSISVVAVGDDAALVIDVHIPAVGTGSTFTAERETERRRSLRFRHDRRILEGISGHAG